MVFESIMGPKSAEKKPWLMFVYGFIYSTFAMFLANYILSDYASLATVFFTTLFFMPLFYRTMIYEERKDIAEFMDEKSLLKEHSKAMLFFIFLFLGLTISFSLWYVIFAETAVFNINPEEIFESQIQTINQINAKVTASPIMQALNLFGIIFQNNIKVMIFCILFSFIFGAGAIFILSWNSSVVGAALGKYVIAIITAGAGSAGWLYIKASTCGLLRYMIHGIPEMVAYFVAGLAGGIISAALINHDFGTSKFEKILLDSSFLIIIAILIIFIGTVIEVFITPMIMCRI